MTAATAAGQVDFAAPTARRRLAIPDASGTLISTGNLQEACVCVCVHAGATLVSTVNLREAPLSPSLLPTLPPPPPRLPPFSVQREKGRDGAAFISIGNLPEFTSPSPP